MEAMLDALANENLRRSIPYLDAVNVLKGKLGAATTKEERSEIRAAFNQLQAPIRPWLHIHGLPSGQILDTLSEAMSTRGPTHVIGPASVIERAQHHGFKLYDGTFDKNTVMNPKEFIALVSSRSYVIRDGVLSLESNAVDVDTRRVPAIRAMAKTNFVFLDADTRDEDVMGAYGALIKIVQTNDHQVILFSASDVLPDFIRGNVVSTRHEESYDPAVFILDQDAENSRKYLSQNMISSAVNDLINQVRTFDPDTNADILLILPDQSLVWKVKEEIQKALGSMARVLEFHEFRPEALAPGRTNVMVTSNPEADTWIFDRLDIVFDAGLMNLHVINERAFSHDVHVPLDRRAFTRRSYMADEYRVSTPEDAMPVTVLDEANIMSPTPWKVRMLANIAPATYQEANQKLIRLYTISPPLHLIPGLDIRPLQMLALIGGSRGFARIIAALQLRPKGSLQNAIRPDGRLKNRCKDKGVGILGAKIHQEYQNQGLEENDPFDDDYLRESLEMVYGPPVKGRIQLGDKGEEFYYKV